MGTSPDGIKDAAEKAEGIVDWIADAIRSRNVKRVIILVTILLLLFNQLSLLKVINLFKEPDLIELPSSYILIYWGVISALIIIAIWTAVREKSVKEQKAKQDEVVGHIDKPSPIKALRPFTNEDAGLFARLQRHQEIRRCLDQTVDPEFRFGILDAPSGSGKTSFLQAGLSPRLIKKGHSCIYVKLTESDPIQTIRYAFAGFLNVPADQLAGVSFRSLLDQAVAAHSKPLVVILDQFEQFFVHFKKKNQRKPFIEYISEWYGQTQHLPITQKVIISIRGDFLYQMRDFQCVMGYSLSLTNSFQLDYFEPHQAKEIFRVIAQEEHLTYDEDFIEELVKEELAHKDDGKVSPVDIQIFAWMIRGQSGTDAMAFNRKAYQRLGGVEGLLEKYLRRTLDLSDNEARKQHALKVLVALINLNENTRAGVLTPEELENKLAGTIKSKDLEDAVYWLSQPSVRLITPVIKQDKKGYELAHERLIPAVRKLISGKDINPAEKANILLNQRVNEWLGNQRSPRYLLTFAEWRSIEKVTPLIDWRAQEAAKRELIRKSRKRDTDYFLLGASAIITIVLMFLIYHSPGLTKNRLKDQIIAHSKEVDDLEILINASEKMFIIDNSSLAIHLLSRAIEVGNTATNRDEKSKAFSKIQELFTATKDTALVDRAVEAANSITDVSYKARALSSIAIATKDAALVDRAVEAANSITHYYSKAHALSSIAEAVAATKDAALVDRAVEAANSITDDYSKASALSSIAIATKDAALVDRAVEAANSITDDYSKARALSSIAEAVAATKDAALVSRVVEAANSITDDYSKASALSSIAEAVAATKDAALVSRAVEAANSITYNSLKASALSSIAIATKDAALVDRAVEAANSITDDSYKASVLSSIAEAVAATKDAALVSRAVEAANSITDDSKARALSRIAIATKDAALVDRAVEAANSITDDSHKPSALSSIAGAVAATKDAALVSRAVEAANSITDDYSKARALSSIAEAVAATKDAALVSRVVEAANSITDDSHKASALSSIAEAVAATKDAALVSRVVEAANSITDDYSKASALSSIAEAVAATKDAALVSRVVEAANSITDDNHKASALSSIAEAVAVTKDTVLYNESFVDILKKASEANISINLRNQLVKYAAILLSQLKEYRKAISLIKKVSNNSQRFSALVEVLVNWEIDNNPELALNYRKRLESNKEVALPAPLPL